MKPAEGATVIGKSVTIRGEVSGHEEMVLDGVFEGTIALPESRLTLGPNARVKADLVAGDVVTEYTRYRAISVTFEGSSLEGIVMTREVASQNRLVVELFV